MTPSIFPYRELRYFSFHAAGAKRTIGLEFRENLVNFGFVNQIERYETITRSSVGKRQKLDTVFLFESLPNSRAKKSRGTYFPESEYPAEFDIQVLSSDDDFHGRS